MKYRVGDHVKAHMFGYVEYGIIDGVDTIEGAILPYHIKTRHDTAGWCSEQDIMELLERVSEFDVQEELDTVITHLKNLKKSLLELAYQTGIDHVMASDRNTDVDELWKIVQRIMSPESECKDALDIYEVREIFDKGPWYTYTPQEVVEKVKQFDEDNKKVKFDEDVYAETGSAALSAELNKLVEAYGSECILRVLDRMIRGDSNAEHVK